MRPGLGAKMPCSLERSRKLAGKAGTYGLGFRGWGLGFRVRWRYLAAPFVEGYIGISSPSKG